MIKIEDVVFTHGIRGITGSKINEIHASDHRHGLTYQPFFDEVRDRIIVKAKVPNQDGGHTQRYFVVPMSSVKYFVLDEERGDELVSDAPGPDSALDMGKTIRTPITLQRPQIRTKHGKNR